MRKQQRARPSLACPLHSFLSSGALRRRVTCASSLVHAGRSRSRRSSLRAVSERTLIRATRRCSSLKCAQPRARLSESIDCIARRASRQPPALRAHASQAKPRAPPIHVLAALLIERSEAICSRSVSRQRRHSASFEARAATPSRLLAARQSAACSRSLGIADVSANSRSCRMAFTANARPLARSDRFVAQRAKPPCSDCKRPDARKVRTARLTLISSAAAAFQQHRAATPSRRSTSVAHDLDLCSRAQKRNARRSGSAAAKSAAATAADGRRWALRR